jgi:hypothetical protein
MEELELYYTINTNNKNKYDINMTTPLIINELSERYIKEELLEWCALDFIDLGEEINEVLISSGDYVIINVYNKKTNEKLFSGSAELDYIPSFLVRIDKDL